MRRSFLILLLVSGTACAQTTDKTRTSTDLLFVESNSSAALQESQLELKRNASDLDALLVEMEAARLQLRGNEEMHSALLLLEKTHGDDPRAQLAAGRIQELAANTSEFRNAIPQLCSLLRSKTPYSRQITSALLTAHADGAPLPRGTPLVRRITKWQIAGPFGEFSNVDFDRSWPPERDQLAAPAYGKLIREQIASSSGELELPNYFPQSGVYYAVSSFRATAEHKYHITIEGEGTYELQLDGRRILLHDSRFHAQRKISRVEMSASAGSHRILLKLHPEAFPIRVWLQQGRTVAMKAVRLTAADQYIKAANSLTDGDLGSALALADDSSSIELTLRAEAQAQLQQSTKARDSLLKASAVDSGNTLAKLRVSQQALTEERFEEAATYLAKVLDTAPHYWPAQELKYKMAVQFDWKQERVEALKQLLRLHPGCSTYLEAAKLHRYDSKQTFYDSRLALCSPRPREYWSELSERGDHVRALLNLEKYLQAHAGDRRALELAVQEAVLSENDGAAHKYAEGLRRVAPNWERASAIAENPESILDSPSAYSAVGAFYLPYVRDALSLLSKGANRNADSEVLINDRVVKLEASGSAWLYQHSVVQVFDKKGIEEAGEVAIPRGADLIELRTIKQDGRSLRPEPGGRKNLISMPSLSEGDAVELAYVQHFRSADLRATPELLDFLFASGEAPTDSSRLTIIGENSNEPVLWFSPDVRRIDAEEGNTHVTTLEAANIPAVAPEPHAPQYEGSTRTLWLSMDASGESDLATKFRDELIAATQVTPIIEQTAANIHPANAQEGIASAYQLIEASVDDDGESWRRGNLTSASDSLVQGEGNRAATMVALFTAMGFDADLMLAAEKGRHNSGDNCPHFRCYTHPLVRLLLASGKRSIILDPQIKGIAAGALSPEVEGEKALLIHRTQTGEPDIATVPEATDQKTRAIANFELDEEGGIRGTVHVRFGSFKGAQMREILHQLSAKDRQRYFEEIGSRIFPHASKLTSSVYHEDDPEKPLELELSLTSAATSGWNGSSLDLGQLIPALGLSRLYATLSERKQDLWLETPLIEESEFTVHLPPGVEVWHMPEPFTAKTTFGEYRTDFRLENGAIKIFRSFRIPMQQVAVAQYAKFCKFALEIDSAEREQLQLRRVAVAQERPSWARAPIKLQYGSH